MKCLTLVPCGRTGDTHVAPSSSLYEYDDLFALKYTAQDANDNNAIDLDGTDRIQGSSTYYEEIDSEWYRTSVSYIWTQTNSTSCTTTSVSRVQVTGLGGAPTVAESLGLGTGNAELQLGIDSNAKCIAFSTSENLNGNTTTNMTFLNASTATKWQISTPPLSARPSIQKTIAGYPVMTVSSLGATNTFTYDGFSRQTSATTTRQASPEVGALGTPSPSSAIVSQVTSNFYNSVGQLSSVSTPLGTPSSSSALITTYEYNSLNRCTGETHLAPGNAEPLLAITNTYNAVGQLIHQYGSTYPIKYEYDSQGRKIAMKTFADPNNPAETQWLYDEPTGLLTNKVYDDGNGPTYTYYPNGKLHTKTLARGIVVSNAYNILGELETTTYSDGTPTITRAYNRLGQLKSTSRGTGEKSFATYYEYSPTNFASSLRHLS